MQHRLGMLWMYEASFLFFSIWKVVSPFIDAATKAKIKFIGKEGQAELQSVIDPAVSLSGFYSHMSIQMQKDCLQSSACIMLVVEAIHVDRLLADSMIYQMSSTCGCNVFHDSSSRIHASSVQHSRTTRTLRRHAEHI